MLLKQPNSLEVDRAELRKTKSAEAMSMAGFLAPTIVIGNYCLRHITTLFLLPLRIIFFRLQKMCPHLALRRLSRPTISAEKNICGNFELKVFSCEENENILFWLDSFPRTPSPQNGRKLGTRSYLKKSSPSMMGRSLDVQTYAGLFFVLTNLSGQLQISVVNIWYVLEMFCKNKRSSERLSMLGE